MLKELQQGQRLLILRYGKQIVENCINLHQEVIDEMGFCYELDAKLDASVILHIAESVPLVNPTK